MMYPGVDFGSMNEEQLMENLNRCRTMLMQSGGNGGSFEHSLRNLIDSYEAELSERRHAQKIQDQGKSQPEVIEIGSIEDISPKP